MTVAKVLNNTGGKNTRVSLQTAEKIKQVADRLEYRPNSAARQLTGKTSKIIGVVLDSCAPSVKHELLSLMEMTAAKKGYTFMIGQAHNNREKIKEYAQIFVSHGVDGFINMAHNYPESDSTCGIAEFYMSLVKTVFFGRPSGSTDCCSVDIDTAGAFEELVTHLKQRGRTRIGLLLVRGQYENPSMSHREVGYLRGLSLNALSANPRWIKKISAEDILTHEKMLPLVQDLVRKQKVNAIVASNDLMAAVVLKNLRTLGVAVPDDVAVTGYDNLDLADLISPTLTTCDHNKQLAAEETVNLMLDLIAGRDIPPERRNILIKPILIQREST